MQIQLIRGLEAILGLHTTKLRRDPCTREPSADRLDINIIVRAWLRHNEVSVIYFFRLHVGTTKQILEFRGPHRN